MINELQLKCIIKSNIITRIRAIDMFKNVFNLSDNTIKDMFKNIDNGTINVKVPFINNNLETDTISMIIDMQDREITNINFEFKEFELIELNDVMDLNECSSLYDLSPSTLKGICQRGGYNLKEHLHYKHSGRVWLITKSAVRDIKKKREYNELNR